MTSNVDPLSALLMLALLVGGLSVAVWGLAGPGKLLKILFAPIGCLLKAVVLLVVLLVGALLYIGSEFDSPLGNVPGGPSVGQGAASQPPSTTPATEVALAEYPVLAQRDSGLYEPAEFADEIDEALAQPVRNLACLATVYLMLRRGRGDADARISADTYNMQDGAVNPGYVDADIAFDGMRVVTEIQASRPVVLHAVGGPLGHHFLLATGLRQGRDGTWVGEANDPWFGEQVEIDLSDASPVHPQLPGLEITLMRLVN